jgi:hypothetical protein
MYDFTNLWADYALYLPAPNDKYAKFAHQPAGAFNKRLPKGIKPADFNILAGRTKLFRWPNALYTAAFGIHDKGDTIFSSPDWQFNFVLGDSGGFSLISGAVFASLASFRPLVLEWQEKCCHVGIIVDVPTRALNNPASGYTSFDICLNATIKSIEFAVAKRSRSDLRLLNVMQGRTITEAGRWYEAVVPYQDQLEGLAIGGHTRLNMWFWIGRILNMIERGLFDRVTHIHFLGTAQPGFAVLATALQRALRKYIRQGITVTFDSSTAFRVAQAYGQITTGLGFDKKKLWLQNYTLPQRGAEVDRAGPFPFRSPLGDICSVGDFLPGVDPYKPATDAVGEQMISNHAMFMELSAILQANRLADMGQQANSAISYDLRQAVQAIDKIFAGLQTGKAFTANKAHLTTFSITDDDGRIPLM